MQQAASTAAIVNDIGLLNAEQMPDFRAFLASKGLPVRDGGGGQFFHVRLPDAPRWMPIERGRAGAPVTPVALRPYVDEFACLPSVYVLSDTSRQFHLVPGALDRPATLSAVASFQGEAKNPALSRYLSDLRDDLALHAPVPWDRQLTVEQNAMRRWEYADGMLATRTTQAGD